MVKLLEDIPSATEHRPATRRPVVTLTVTAVAMVVAAALGVILLVTGGDDTRPDTTVTGDGGAEVPMASWVDGVTQACTQVAQAHPILTEGADARMDPANVATVDAASRDLAIAVRGVQLPTGSEDATRATEAVQLGDTADQAWYALAALPVDQLTGDQLTEAAAATSSFATRLDELGATSCAALT